MAHPGLIQPLDPEGLRRWHRDHKDLRLRRKLVGEREAVRRFVRGGDYIGVDLYGTVRCPLSLVREIVRQGPRRLRLAGQGFLNLDLLLAAGLVESIDLAYVGCEAYGVSPILRRAVEGGKVRAIEWSNGALAWRLKAAAMGVPFLPARSMLGSDTLRNSNAKVMKDPFTGLRVALLPALAPDCGIVHVHRADAYGNCQIDGVTGCALELARASKRLIVSAEELIETDEILEHPERTVIPFYLVDAVVHAPFGAHPGETCGLYERDEPHIQRFLEAARSPEAVRAYLREFVHGVPSHAKYLERIGSQRLRSLRIGP